jgi:hypothetical protein
MSTSFHSNEYVAFIRYGLILFIPSYNNVFNIKITMTEKRGKGNWESKGPEYTVSKQTDNWR